MSGETRDGKCSICKERRKRHKPDDEGLRKLCPDGSGNTFKWPTDPGRVSISMNAEEAKVFDIVRGQAMAESASISESNPQSVELWRNTRLVNNK